MNINVFTLILTIFCFVQVSSGTRLSAHWGEWSQWSQCSASCGSGTSSRKTKWVVNGYSTNYVFYDTVECNTPVVCPIDGYWSLWSEWAICPVLCGGGIHRRERWCNSPKPKHGGRSCLGQNEDFERCNTVECPEIPKDFKLSSCNASHFMCNSGLYCVWKRLRCDDQLHCDDGSDEMDCENFRAKPASVFGSSEVGRISVSFVIFYGLLLTWIIS